MADDWCEVMEMPKLGCAHCRPAAERRRLAAIEADLNTPGGHIAPRRDVNGQGAFTTGAAIPARYPGRCAGDCGEPIEIGQEIIRVGAGAWAHLDCA